MTRSIQTKEASSVSEPAVDKSGKRAERPVRKVAKSPAFISLYTNDVQIMTSPFDMRLILGEIGEADATIMNVTQLCEIRMSPQLAKKVTMIMSDQIKFYETT